MSTNPTGASIYHTFVPTTQEYRELVRDVDKLHEAVTTQGIFSRSTRDAFNAYQANPAMQKIQEGADLIGAATDAGCILQ